MTCDKTTWASKAAARRAARRLRAETGEPFRPYVCTGPEGCGRWHVSTAVDHSAWTPRPSHTTSRSRRPVVRTVEELQAVAAAMRRGRR